MKLRARSMIVAAILLLSLLAIHAPMTALGAPRLKFGVSLPSTNPYWVKLREGIEAEAASKGVDLTIMVCNENPAKQLTDVEDMIQRKPDFMLITPVDRTAGARAVETAVAAGIPVITVARFCDTDKAICGIANDEVLVGRTAAEFIVKYFGAKGGSIVWLQGPLQAQSILDIAKGFQEVMDRNPQIKILGKLGGVRLRPEAMQQMEDLLQAHPKIDLVFGSYDEMALGALAAIEASGRTTIQVVGSDGQAEARDAIRSGKMLMSIMKQPGMIGVLAIDTALDYLDGKRDIPKIVYAPLVVLTKENIDKVDTRWAP